ncbi:site-2 protease family protein [candidate division KSB1 bacterium]|nr:site-2 protease family protein [candidate division KSB1 bacterium]
MNIFKRPYLEEYIVTGEPPRQKYTIHIVLFLITVLTTLMAGAIYEGVNPITHIYRGIPFSFTLLLILGIHEMGHYLTARRFGMLVTLPYFIPAPTILGTIGAIIRMKSPMWNRKVLVYVGAAGPIVGFLIALPVTIYGFVTSPIREMVPGQGGILLGDSILLKIISAGVIGELPEGHDVFLNSVAWAGWIGLFVTSFNLFPFGQLDGGHIVYALFGERVHWLLSRYVFIGLLLLGILWIGWWFIAIFLFFLGFRHPRPVDDLTPLEYRERLIGWFALAMFILCFIPVPFSSLIPQ